jgi:ClpP class serine protease
MFGGCSYMQLVEEVQAAEADPNVKQLIFVFDTPGGTVQGCQLAADTIARGKKPKMGLVDAECASAGLWLASQLDKVVSVQPGSVGSLGCMMRVTSFAKMYEEAGIDARVLRSAVSPNKNKPMATEELTDENLAYWQAKVDKYGQMFVDAVAKGRKRSPEYVLANFGQGHMLDSDEALAVGLIDEIGTMASLMGSGSTKVRATATRANWLV